MENHSCLGILVNINGGIPLERGYPGMLTSLPQGLINNTTRSKKVWHKILRGYVWCFNMRSLSPKMVFFGENYLIKDFFLTKELTVA